MMRQMLPGHFHLPLLLRARAIKCWCAVLGPQSSKLHNIMMRRYREVGGAELCGGVPFFFNTTTGNSVCGAQQCEVLACISCRTAFRVFLHACKIQNLMDGICSVANCRCLHGGPLQRPR